MNQNPEQKARDEIDKLLTASGWIIQDKKKVNLSAGTGIAIREYQTDVGPADYVLFLDKKPVGIIEAKREEEGVKLTVHEDQSVDYATAKLKYINNGPLRFVYESTGEVTRFTDYRDPKPRSRPVFTFHRPETFQKWVKEAKTLRGRFNDILELPTEGLRDCQIQAITNLEKSFRENRPKALIQMATGSGKTFTAITFIYRLLKFAKAKRILFLVDTKNLGEQAEQEFKRYEPQDDNRLFPELYGVTRLNSAFVPTDSEVYISTIQRLYSILKGTPLDERDEEENPNEGKWQPKEPLPVVYNEKIPMEFFDFVVIDECHRSIYNLWKQVLDYFDAFQIGLTATPDNRTFGYFNQNLVCDYGYQKAVEDGVLVPYNVFEIVTKITLQGAKIDLGEYVGTREKLTRKQFWNTLDEEVEYRAQQLDEKVVNPNQIRLIAKAVKDNLPAMFPDRLGPDGKFEVPKMLIFAKSDSHADDIINIVREEFAEENKFCKKITYRTEDPKGVLQQFRNSYYPRVAVTVDMIATGTDIRPLEVLLFMRDVKSRSYYEQMKGRGTRTCSLEELKATGTPAAKFTKDHFVIIDAIGVEKSRKTDSRPLEKKPGLSLKEVLEGIAMGNKDEDMLTTLANRLIRLNKQINEKEKIAFAEKAGGLTINQVVKQLLHAYDPDTLENTKLQVQGQNPGAAPDVIEAQVKEQHEQIIEQATAIFNDYDLRNYVIDIRKKYDQVIDHINPDELVNIGWVKDNKAEAENLVQDFRSWIETHQTEITALQLFYGQPYGRRELTYKMMKDLVETIKAARPNLAPLNIWRAYEQLEKVNGQPKNELMALVALIRKVSGLDETLTAYDKTVDRNFQEWVFKKQAGTLKFTETQMQWLRMIKDYVANSFRLERDDFDLSPFNAHGGLGKMWQLFGDKTDEIINELNEELAA
ncbi:type III restriction endonuclease subunit R [Adhaeribacter aerolatus]|uniref:Type III restriction endonuclease subunit R n=1 Tax=Adhaeribacter aerolatus TaxID=670289 RepID=A0A512B2V1_9BACT|nr:DEAD/DEAH box helicase family protein [Adhaeribacter aerolatus]GEO06305.1 type III restriction endonuclease subunit R [Adhaeribacter aerolatus]